MPVPNTFGTATAAIPLSQLDANFATPITIGNTAVQLGNTVTTLNNMTLANVTISSGEVTIGNVSVAGNVTLTGGTANAVAYLNGSKVLTTGTALAFNGSKLGIGVSSFDVPLQVQAITGGLAMRFNGRASPNDSYSDIGFYNSANTTQAAGIGAATSGLFLATTLATPITFSINSAEAGRFDSSGNLQVGTTSNPVYGSTTAKLNILKGSGQYVINSTVSATSAEGQIAFRNPNGIVGEIVTTGTATSYGVGTSDYRAKESVTNYTGGLNAITSLRPVSFTWKASQEQDVGFIAHEIQAVIPSTVHGEKDAVDEDGKPKMQTIFPAPPQMIANLVAAIQEQQALITTLTARITALESA